MKYGRQAPISPPERVADAGHGWRAGFTLIEVVIAIVILGILSAAVAVNWASFIRYQELRQDAHGLHKELIALKAKALETDSTVTVTFTENSGKYNVQIYVPDTSVPDGEDMDTLSWDKSLNKDVKIKFLDNNDMGTFVDITLPSTNGWKNKVKIKHKGIDPFDDDGWVVISNGKNKEFCIIKTEKSIKPELYSRTKNGTGGGKWTKI